MKRILCFVAAVLMVASLAGCTGEATVYQRAETADFRYSMYASLPEASAELTETQTGWLTDYRTVTENGILRLYVQESTGNIAVLDKRIGQLYFSVPPTMAGDTTATEDTKKLMQSALLLTYFDGQVEKAANSFELSDPDKLTCEAIDDGVRVTYVLGDGKRGLADMPQKLSDARFQELFVNHPELKESDKKRAKIYYEQDETTGVWSLTDTKNTTLNLLSQILDRIGYTDEDLKKDNDENGLPTQASDRLTFTVPVEYTLEAESLRTTVPMDKVLYTSTKPLLSICVNQFFGATAGKDGAILLPEGTGGLMLFSQADTDTGSYSSGLYGSDDTYTREDSKQADNNNNLPLFGLYEGNHGFLCIIEKGDSLATVGAEKANSRTDLNGAWVTFSVRGVIRAILGDGSMQSDVRVVQDEMYTGALSYKHSFLTGETLSYADLANYYRGYLTAKYGLKPNAEKTMPLQLSLIGGVRVKKSFLGFQYNGTRVLTDYASALSLCEELKGKGISSINLLYSGVLGGGLGKESISSLSLDKALGKKALLQKLAEQEGVSLHLSLSALTVPKDASGFSRYSQTAKTIDDSLSKKYYYNTVDLSVEKYDYIVSPLHYSALRESLTAFAQKTAFEGLAFADLGNRLYSHNEGTVLFREDTQAIVVEQLAQYAKDYALILSNPYEPALPYTDSIVDLPSARISKAVDRSVPFYQMVLHSLVGYSGEPINESVDYSQAVLACAETGSLPYFKLFTAPQDSLTDTEFSSMYSHGYSTWSERVVSVYEQLSALHAQVGDQPIIGHDCLQEGVYRTVYGNSMAVYTNYNTSAVTVDGVTVEAESYRIEVMA